MESESNQDLKAKMKAALSRKSQLVQVSNSELENKSKKVSRTNQNIEKRKIHRRKAGST